MEEKKYYVWCNPNKCWTENSPGDIVPHGRTWQVTRGLDPKADQCLTLSQARDWCEKLTKQYGANYSYEVKDVYTKQIVLFHKFSDLGANKAAVNDHVCPTCRNDRCSKIEKTCWKCGSPL